MAPSASDHPTPVTPSTPVRSNSNISSTPSANTPGTNGQLMEFYEFERLKRQIKHRNEKARAAGSPAPSSPSKKPSTPRANGDLSPKRSASVGSKMNTTGKGNNGRTTTLSRQKERDNITTGDQTRDQISSRQAPDCPQVPPAKPASTRDQQRQAPPPVSWPNLPPQSESPPASCTDRHLKRLPEDSHSDNESAASTLLIFLCRVVSFDQWSVRGGLQLALWWPPWWPSRKGCWRGFWKTCWWALETSGCGVAWTRENWRRKSIKALTKAMPRIVRDKKPGRSKVVQCRSPEHPRRRKDTPPDSHRQEQSALPLPPKHPRRRKDTPPDSHQQEESALPLPPTPREAHEPHQLRRILAGIFVVLAVLALFAYSILPLDFRITNSSYQPVDDLYNATLITADAMDLLSETDYDKMHAKYYACKMMELAEQLYEAPLQHVEFREAWSLETESSGWECPKPGWVTDSKVHKRLHVRFDEVLGRHGVELATALWNMTTIFQRSLTESLEKSQEAVDHARHTKIEMDRSDICRNIDSGKFSNLVSIRTSGEEMQLLVLNEKLGLLNSTLSSLTASHPSLIRDLETTATICLRHHTPFQQGTAGRGYREQRDAEAALKKVEAYCNPFVRRGLQMQSARKTVDTWSPEEGGVDEVGVDEVGLSRFLKAQELFDHAHAILHNVTTGDPEPRNDGPVVFKWIDQPVWTSQRSYLRWFLGLLDNFSLAAPENWQLRCRRLNGASCEGNPGGNLEEVTLQMRTRANNARFFRLDASHPENQEQEIGGRSVHRQKVNTTSPTLPKAPPHQARRPQSQQLMPPLTQAASQARAGQKRSRGEMATTDRDQATSALPVAASAAPAVSQTGHDEIASAAFIDDWRFGKKRPATSAMKKKKKKEEEEEEKTYTSSRAPASVANIPTSDNDQESDWGGGSSGKRKGTRVLFIPLSYTVLES
ncbi:unnamed protein product [Zymoseptoria tritici ST99CH_3D1]|nr:unnamed protein product [Zymoseptoria tritici ST99CH_3D1]